MHRAVLRDDRDVAVEIQYPGVAQAFREDMANTELVASFCGALSHQRPWSSMVLVFPGGGVRRLPADLGGEHDRLSGPDRLRPHRGGRGVPIVPVVSIGGQQPNSSSPRRCAGQEAGLQRIRLRALPLTFGFPFGLTTVLPPNLPRPTKIITELQEPIGVGARFGEDPDVDEVDAYVRSVMQTALDQLVRQRRFPLPRVAQVCLYS